jgi:hypothetical protein
MKIAERRGSSMVRTSHRRIAFMKARPPYNLPLGTVGSPVTHGGLTSSSFCKFILLDLLRFNSKQLSNHTFCELGCARATMSFLAASLSEKARSVVAIEIERTRYDYAVAWRSACQEELSHFSGRTSQYLPSLRHMSFSSRTDTLYNFHLSHRKMIFWANNYNGVWSGDDTQETLEDRIRHCKIGSVVVAFDRMFRDDLAWNEEVYEVVLRKRDLSWSTPRQPRIELDSKTRRTIFKYTKNLGSRGRNDIRPRNLPQAKQIDYPYLNNHWQW